MPRLPTETSAARPTDSTLTPRSLAQRARVLWLISLAAWPLAATHGCVGDCDGGERLIDGVCLPPCETANCKDGLVCVRNMCRPECTSDDECEGEDTCERIRNDDGDVARYCYGPALEESPYASSNHTSVDAGSEPVETSCDSSLDCPQDVSRHCVTGRCETECTLHQHCGSAGACTGNAANAEGSIVTYCEPDELPRAAGQFGSGCLASTQICDSSNDFMCLTEGEGDTDAYCTLRGCDTDAECPTGLFCSHNLVGARPPCATACGITGQPNNSECIPESDIGVGRPYRCSPAGGLELTVCLKRAFCAPCEVNADCRAEDNQICARGPDGNKTCTVLCAEGLGSCPWGTATQCAVFDQELGEATCAPLFGACHGTGKSCEPCVDDADCPTGFCSVSSFTGEQFCFDETASCSCAAGEESCVGGGCPLTPSGLRMNCLSRSEGEAPSVCYGAELSQESGTPLGCW
jgi:hypothetical protein